MQRAKVLTEENGEKIIHAKWCLVVDHDTMRALCNGVALDSFSDVDFKMEDFDPKSRGKITCQDCINEITRLQSIKL